MKRAREGGVTIGHFRVPSGLCIKTRLGAQPLIWQRFFILIQIKLISTRTVQHLTSFWYRGPGNSEMAYLALSKSRALNFLWIPAGGFQLLSQWNLDSGLSEFQWDQAQDSGNQHAFHKQKFPGSPNPDFLVMRLNQRLDRTKWICLICNKWEF